MATLKEIVFDARDPPRLARFWAAALEGYRVRSYDASERRRLARRGLTPDTDPTVAVDGDGPTLFFQLAPRPKTTRNRVHLDLACGSRADEVARLVSLGARVRDTHAAFTVMLDPEGNEFCIQEPTP
jgi:hypothetical protein